MWSKPPLRILAPLSLLVGAAPVVALPLVALAPPAAVQARSAEPQLRILLKEGSSLEIAASEAPLRIADGRGRELLQLQPGTGLRLSATATALRTEPLTAGTPQPPRSLPLAELWIEPLARPRRRGIAPSRPTMPCSCCRARPTAGACSCSAAARGCRRSM